MGSLNENISFKSLNEKHRKQASHLQEINLNIQSYNSRNLSVTFDPNAPTTSAVASLRDNPTFIKENQNALCPEFCRNDNNGL